MDAEYNVTAKTVEEAIAKATELYGGDDKEISYEIISMPKKGLFGIGSKEAVIKVTVEENVKLEIGDLFGDMKSKKVEKNSSDNRNSGKKNGSPARSEAQNEKKDNKIAKAPTDEKKSSLDKAKSAPDGGKSEEQSKVNKAPAKAPEQREKAEKPFSSDKVFEAPAVKSAGSEASASSDAEKKSGRASRRGEREYKKVGVSEEEMKYALDFVNTLISNMKLNAKAEAATAPEGEEYQKTEDAQVYPAIDITGEDTGILIGRHGETLDAIQYLVNLSSQRRTVGRRGHESLKIKVDVENYREKREETLKALARKMAARAVKYKKNIFLEPMNPYERRIIHAELQDFENVSTHSIGSDKNRKIIITYEGPGKRKAGPSDRQRDEQ